MNTPIIGVIIGAVAGDLVAAVILFVFFTKVLYPIFLEKHEDLIIEILFGDDE